MFGHPHRCPPPLWEDHAPRASVPVGLMIDGVPWIRSPQRLLHLMTSTDLEGETRAAMRRLSDELKGPPAGGLFFNCILRRLEMDAQRSHEQFLEALRPLEISGFHTYGESWLGHINTPVPRRPLWRGVGLRVLADGCLRYRVGSLRNPPCQSMPRA